MNKINNSNQLEAEIKRLRDLSKDQELRLRNHLKDIREDLKPQNILINSLSGLTGVKIEPKSFLKEGIAYAISIFIQRFILKSESKIEQRAYEFLDKVFERIKSFIGKHSSHEAKREERNEEREKSAS